MIRTGSPQRVGPEAPSGTRVARALKDRAAWTFDVGACLAFVAIAYSMRRDGLPTDGLWFDDAWVVAGAVMASPGNILVTGSAHPGFTTLIALIDRAGGGFTAMAFPALVAGCLGPVAVYWLLRRIGQARAVAVLLAAVLVVAPVHVTYSGRVKSYTLDLLWTSLFTFLVVRLTRVRWTWRVGAAWLAVVAVGSSFSGYVVVASAIAVVVLVLHAGTDRLMRIGVAGVQGLLQLVYLITLRTKTDLDAIEAVMESAFDGHMTFHANPVAFGRETLKHLHRVGEVYPSGPSAVVTATVAVAIVGLFVASIRRVGRSAIDQRTSVAARYLAALVAFAFVGGMVDRFPFGPSNENYLAQGGRHTLWLAPALFVGLATVAGLAWHHIARHGDFARLAVNAVLLSASVAILVHGHRTPHAYPESGSSTLTEAVDNSLEPGDRVIIFNANFAFAASTSQQVEVFPTPERMVGFIPRYSDQRFQSMGPWGIVPRDEDRLLEIIADSDRALLVTGGWFYDQDLEWIRSVVEPHGYEMTELRFGTARLLVVDRAAS